MIQLGIGLWMMTHIQSLIVWRFFWNSRNITVYDSYISGEYLGWNSKNLTFENCIIESRDTIHSDRRLVGEGKIMIVDEKADRFGL